MVRVARGEEHYQIVGTTTDVQGLMRVLAAKGRLDVEAIRDVAAPDEEAGSTPWRDLTDKQLEALVLAYLGGYYQWPRDRSASTLAEELGLSSSAFLDHLRHAEAKLVSAVMEDMRTHEPGRIEALRARRVKRDLALPVTST
jgi:predicted DNA binding protein